MERRLKAELKLPWSHARVGFFSPIHSYAFGGEKAKPILDVTGVSAVDFGMVAIGFHHILQSHWVVWYLWTISKAFFSPPTRARIKGTLAHLKTTTHIPAAAALVPMSRFVVSVFLLLLLLHSYSGTAKSLSCYCSFHLGTWLTGINVSTLLSQTKLKVLKMSRSHRTTFTRSQHTAFTR